jgi:cytochrome P450
MKFIILGAILAVVALLLLWPRKRYFPGPHMYGYFGTVFVGLRHLARRHRWWRDLAETYGSRIQLTRSSASIMFVVHEPEDVRFVLTNKEVFPDRPKQSGFRELGESVLSLPIGDEWAKRRRLLSPLFAEKFMKEYCLMIVRVFFAFAC